MDEIRPHDEVKASWARVSREELQMAERLIESWTTEWKPEKYKDTDRESIERSRRRAKAAGIEGRSKMTKAELIRALQRAA